MRRCLVFLAAVLAAVCAPPPGTHLVPVVPVRLAPADSVRFARNLERARFLAAYHGSIRAASDSVRAQVNDAVRPRLGAEWFCFPGDDGRAHAVFGRYDTLAGRYDAVFHYAVDPDGAVGRMDRVPSPGVTLPRARAVNRALALARPASVRERVAFNPYVRARGDTLEVLLLPGADPDGTLTYGYEYAFRFTGTGLTLADSGAVADRIRGVRPGEARRVSLVNRSRDVPTAGQLFFVLVHNGKFDDIRIENRATLTYYRPDAAAGERWIHTAKLVAD